MTRTFDPYSGTVHIRRTRFPSTTDFDRWFRETPIDDDDLQGLQNTLLDGKSRGDFSIDTHGSRTFLRAYGGDLVLVLTEKSRKALIGIIASVIGRTP